jgi:L-amino acid N-acyltransferase YncA
MITVTITVRPAHPLDARPMAAILSEIVAIGGTTAITGTIEAEDIRAWMATAPARSAWHVAETPQGEIMGFQWIAPGAAYLPPEAAEIATFAKPGQQGLGIGSRLFAATEQAARALGYGWINANIRADNAGGLIYYQSRGFEDYGRIDGYRMENGQIVDKILKRYDLG